MLGGVEIGCVTFKTVIMDILDVFEIDADPVHIGYIVAKIMHTGNHVTTNAIKDTPLYDDFDSICAKKQIDNINRAAYKESICHVTDGNYSNKTRALFGCKINKQRVAKQIKMVSECEYANSGITDRRGALAIMKNSISCLSQPIKKRNIYVNTYRKERSAKRRKTKYRKSIHDKPPSFPDMFPDRYAFKESTGDFNPVSPTGSMYSDGGGGGSPKYAPSPSPERHPMDYEFPSLIPRSPQRVEGTNVYEYTKLAPLLPKTSPPPRYHTDNSVGEQPLFSVFSY